MNILSNLFIAATQLTPSQLCDSDRCYAVENGIKQSFIEEHLLVLAILAILAGVLIAFLFPKVFKVEKKKH